MAQTGNTKKIAEAIYGEIAAEKDIKPLAEVVSLDAYDLAFIGFPSQEQPDATRLARAQSFAREIMDGIS